MNDLLALLTTNYALTPPVSPFALAASGINNETCGIQTGAGKFVWKHYTKLANVATLAYEHDLLRWLAQQPLSFAVPVPLSTAHGITLVAVEQGWGALFPLLPGQRPDPSDADQIAAVGAGLGELHRALAGYPTKPRPGLSTYAALTQVHPLLPDPFHLTPMTLGLPNEEPQDRLLAWWRDEVAQIEEWVANYYAALPHQVIHGDFGPSNTLYADGRLTAMLDFEMALPDARAIDVAAGLTFGMRPWENARPFLMLGSFLQGYRQWIELTPAEIRAMPWLMRLRAAVAAIWWLGHGLAAHDVSRALSRLVEMQALVAWLAKHTEAFQNDK